ncbi:hypothetical protein L873DRAFT_1811637 [Choiromyces venosus 120613-1]|uniref:Paired domain-containing protein n=1 Tax=Choiromyces venosus 120613-1 TaxID=1336337 RepID=A0A3N4JQZ8_9PEZI|nr:hypothetical protein L873DRAFT_1811637 [Choiromyces venosus 120613-1]
MAPPHTQKGYKQISKKTGVPVPTVQGIVKRYHTYGQIEDAPRSGRPTLLSQYNLEAIE